MDWREGQPLCFFNSPSTTFNLEKILQGTALSPLLAIRGEMASGLPLVIADGYHRLCASHLFDENAEVQYRIVDRPD